MQFTLSGGMFCPAQLQLLEFSLQREPFYQLHVDGTGLLYHAYNLN
jgi:hypothetical protein